MGAANRYTAAQNASFKAWEKKHPFPPFKKDTPAQIKAYDKAHPFPNTPLSKAQFDQWISKHPFKGQKPIPLTAADRQALHTAHVKHLAHLKAVARKTASSKARSLSRGDIGCCTAEAVAAYLHLGEKDMLDLFRRAGGHPEKGIPIAEMLTASGLPLIPADADTPGDLILGIDLPGPHAVLATADGWWSWGELHCPCEFPDAVIEEAWIAGSVI